jgi:hypothetical protein
VNSEVIPVFQEFYQYPNTFTIKGAIRSGDKVFAVDTFSKQIQFWDFRFYAEGAGMEERLNQYFNYGKAIVVVDGSGTGTTWT